MRHKKEQTDTFIEGITTLNPAVTLEQQQRIRAKTQTKDETEFYMDTLLGQFRIRLIDAIKKCIKQNKNIQELYEQLMDKPRLPRGVVADAEKTIDSPGKIARMLNTKQGATKVHSVEYWRKYVRKNFETLHQSIQSQPEGAEDKEGDAVDEADEYDDDEEIRACSTSFNAIVRNDLSPQIRDIMMDKLCNIMKQVSMYMSDYSLQVLKIALSFGENAFVSHGQQFVFAQQDQERVNYLLPAGCTTDPVMVPRPLNADLLRNNAFLSYFDSLFQEPHLDRIHTAYFGVKGATRSSTPLEKAIISAIPPDDEDTFENLPSHPLRMARALFKTNFKNMWSDNTIANKLLKRLLRYLLLINLAPGRDSKFKENMVEKQKKYQGKKPRRVTNCSIPENCISLINKTRNGRRRLFKNEEKKIKIYEEKGLIHSAELCRDRIETYRRILSKEVSGLKLLIRENEY